MIIPVLQACGVIKRYGHVTALDGADFDLLPGETLPVIGDDGEGKSTLIKALSGALILDGGEIQLDGKQVKFHGPSDAHKQGIETVYQDLAVAPAMSIAENLFLGREIRKAGLLGNIFALLDKKRMLAEAIAHMKDLQVGIRSMKQAGETLSGGQRQGVAVARSAAFARHVVIMDEPTAALGVKESNMVLDLPPRALQGPAGDPDQPKHAARIRDRRSHPHRPSRQARLRGQPEKNQHVRHGRRDDRRKTPGRTSGGFPCLDLAL